MPNFAATSSRPYARRSSSRVTVGVVPCMTMTVHHRRARHYSSVRLIRSVRPCPTVTCMSQRYDRATVRLFHDRPQCRRRHDLHRHGSASSTVTYVCGVAVDRELSRTNYSRFVQSALDAALARGLTDLAVAEATGVGTSTFHRWRRGDWGNEWPKLQQVIDFCRGLGIPEEDAFAALGLRGERTPTAPAPLDPDVLRLLRALA